MIELTPVNLRSFYCPIGIAQKGKLVLPSDQELEQAVVNPSDDTVTLPRWVVYFQGALLGVVATTFFIFGMMVGSLTNPTSVKTQSCRVSGQVYIVSDGSTIPDPRSVVILLPVDAENIQRQPPETLHPSNFKPLNNPAIEMIHAIGGAVVRANEKGAFEFYVDSPRAFDLLVIANQKGREDLSKAQMAGISKFFLPVENLLKDNKFLWKRVSTNGAESDLGRITVR